MLAKQYFLAICLVLLAQYSTQTCQNGQQTKKGNFWYECVNGNDRPIACVADDGSRIELGSRYQTESFVIQCSQPAQGGIQMEPVACVNQGNVVNIGQTFTKDQTFYYRCARDSSDLHSLKIELAGCVGANGELVVNNGVVKRGSFVYKCVVTPQGVSLKPEGCLFEGRQYQINQDIESPGVWYRCESDPAQRSIAIKPKGCLRNGVKYAVNAKFNDGAFVFQCRQQGNSIMVAGVGCVERYPNGTVTEYGPGSKWLVGDGPYNKYQIECRMEGVTIRRQAVQCYYDTPEGKGYLRDGCMRQVGQIRVQCTPITAQNPNVRIKITERPTAADEARFQSMGLRSC